GPIGLLLSTPLTVVLVVMGKHVPQMQFLDILLGDAPALSPAEKFYQRLLALDAEESTDLAREYRKQMPLEKVYDEVLLPALAAAEQDRQRGQLDDRRRAFIRQSFKDIIEELGEDEQAHAESPSADRISIPEGCAVSVLCLPARDQADEIAA